MKKFNKKILIFGKGFIGERLRDFFDCDISSRIISKLADAEEEIQRFKPQVIVNCIGYTGSRNVDDCELDKDMTLTANTFVPIILAEAALRNGLKLVHISSGCIYHYDYQKSTPLKETDIPDFFDLFYSRSKIYAERALEVLSNQYNILICRIRIPLDDRPHPKNILDKLIKYKRVIDVPNSVTYIPDFLKMLEHLLYIDAKGIYNCCNKGGLYYPQLLSVYKKFIPDFQFEVIKVEVLKMVRTNLILSVAKLEQSGFVVREIKDVLEECVQNYFKNLNTK
ncbi:MAG: sugar nucleotide-binding protein [Candidatus Omnitrophica bacterium]|nr:sugar nucleotide-binding protein [Candidatus Omnitrophota bacterium]